MKNPFPSIASDCDRRRQSRHDGTAFTCCLGEVIDASPTGIRVFHKGASPCKQGQTLKAQLCHAGAAITLEAQVIWVEKAGIRRQIIGLEFVEMAQAQADELARLFSDAHDEFVGPRLWIAA